MIRVPQILVDMALSGSLQRSNDPPHIIRQWYHQQRGLVLTHFYDRVIYAVVVSGVDMSVGDVVCLPA